MSVVVAFTPRAARASENMAQDAYLRALELQRAVIARPSFANIVACADQWRRYCVIFAALNNGSDRP